MRIVRVRDEFRQFSGVIQLSTEVDAIRRAQRNFYGSVSSLNS